MNCVGGGVRGLDYAEAAQKQGRSTVRFEDRKVLILSENSPIVGTSEEVAAEIMEK